MSKTINYSAWPLKLWNVVCLLLLLGSSIALSAAAVTWLHGKAFMCYTIGRGVHLTLLVPSCTRGTSGHYLFRYV